MQTQPVNARHVGKTFNQFGQRKTSVYVSSVAREILRDDVELGISLGCQGFHLLFDVFDCARFEPSGNQRNGAESAEPVASFGNLDIGVWRRPKGIGV